MISFEIRNTQKKDGGLGHKDAEQLRSYCVVDLRLCFRILGRYFLMTRLNYLIKGESEHMLPIESKENDLFCKYSQTTLKHVI